MYVIFIELNMKWDLLHTLKENYYYKNTEKRIILESSKKNFQN